MDNKQKQQLYEESKIKQNNFVIAAQNPNIKGRITTNITEPDGEVHWFIRFNIPLDPTTVNRNTMNITDKKGYILNSIITYDDTRNLIVLNPMDLYRQNESYILNVSKKVRPARGKPLKKSIHILFKIVNNEISEFEILKSTANIPKARKKPSSLRRQEVQELLKSKAYSKDVDVIKKVGSPTLPYGAIGIKLHLAIIGLSAMTFSLLSQNTIVIIGGMVAALLGFLHIIFQMRKPNIRSAIIYAFGVSAFNKGKYAAAQKSFEKAIEQNHNNELAEYALNKVYYFLKTK
ncbi:MAG: tetratricopeptide repeat protein [Defluviitaleaceae bacterium]|nr:tetratricopeptide repeat protein [Defluviitaleaceae bacterium]